MADVTTALDVLVRAREFLSDPTHWTQGALYARRGGTGEIASACSMGAICYGINRDPSRELSEDELVLYRAAREYIDAALPSKLGATQDANIMFFNDRPDRTHAEILAVFDEAIGRAATDLGLTPFVLPSDAPSRVAQELVL